MANVSRVKKLQHIITNVLLSTGNKSFSTTDIEDIYRKYQFQWRLPASTTSNKFLKQIVNENIVEVLVVNVPSSGINKHIYYFPNVLDEEIALSISNRAFLSHYSALYYHGLTEQIPKEIIITIEDYQRITPIINLLSQDGIHSAFSKPQRESNSVFDVRNSRVRIHKGNYSNETGVIKIGTRVTNIERTLIDIVVRQSYSGGLSEVVKVFQKAGSEKLISINRLLNYLSKLNYTYPYHQCIGFLMEKTGAFNESQFSKLESMPIQYDFYLSYNITKLDYDAKWKVFYPKNLFA